MTYAALVALASKPCSEDFRIPKLPAMDFLCRQFSFSTWQKSLNGHVKQPKTPPCLEIIKFYLCSTVCNKTCVKILMETCNGCWESAKTLTATFSTASGKRNVTSRAHVHFHPSSVILSWKVTIITRIITPTIRCLLSFSSSWDLVDSHWFQKFRTNVLLICKSTSKLSCLVLTGAQAPYISLFSWKSST